MRENRTSGSMSGLRKPNYGSAIEALSEETESSSYADPVVTAPQLDSTTAEPVSSESCIWFGSRGIVDHRVQDIAGRNCSRAIQV